MKLKLSIVCIGLFWVSVYLIACKRDEAQPVEDRGLYLFSKPDYFPDPVVSINDKALTDAGFELGRKLFYEVQLSSDNTISCGSCHVSYAAFSHPGHDVSHGVGDRLGRRNSMPIMNLAWSTSYMWDGGVFHLELQPMVPITAHEEMNETLENVAAKLQASVGYPSLFQEVFGSDQISSTYILKALSYFMLSTVSAQSKFDSVIYLQSKEFSSLEAEGYQVFRQYCQSCHTPPLFTNNKFANNGLTYLSSDSGRFAVTLQPQDVFTFKIPSLRNVAVTSPYMHDGRIRTLKSAIRHYTQIQNNNYYMPTMDSVFTQGANIGLPLSVTEIDALEAFLNTLTDVGFINNKKYQE